MEHINVNLVPGGVPSICHASQYDEGRVIRAHLFDGILPHTLSGTETIILSMRKTDLSKHVYTLENSSSDYIDIVTTSDMCSIAGDSECEFIITDSSNTIGTANFKMKIEPDAYGNALKTRSVSGPIATFETDLAEDLIKLDVDLEPIQDLHGYDGAWPAGGGKNISHFGTDNLDNSQQCTITYIDDNNLSIDAAGNYTRAMYAIMCPENTTVTVSFKGSSTANYKKVQISSVNSWSGISWYRIFNLTEQETTYSYTFTTSAGSTTIYIGFYVTAGADTGTMYIKDFQIEKGSSATSFAPYENICPITGHDSAKLFRTGKNLLDTRQESIPQYAGGSGVYANVTYTPNSDGSITINGTSTGASVLFFNPVTLNPITSYPFPTWKYTNNRYTFSVTDEWGLVTGDAYIQATVKKIKDDTIVSRQRLTASALTRSFTVREDEYIADTFVRLSSGASASNINIKIQLELDSTVTNYEPYTSDPTPITVQFGQTVYEGHLDSTNRRVLVTKKAVKIKDLTWSYVSSFTYFSATVSDIASNIDAGRVLDGLMCEVYTNRTPTQAGSGNKNGSIAGFYNALRIKDLAYDNKDDLINAVGDYLIVYPLAEPFYIDLTQPVPAGINKLPFEDIIQNGWTNTISDVTATYSNGVVHVEGTNNSGNWANIVLFINAWADNPITLPAGTYIMSENLVIRCSIDGGDYANKSTSFTAESSVVVQGFYTSVKNGDTVDWEIPLMLINGTTRPTEYFPYYVTADPIRIPALVGTNNIYSDAGDVTVEYYAIEES